MLDVLSDSRSEKSSLESGWILKLVHDNSIRSTPLIENLVSIIGGGINFQKLFNNVGHFI
jgi:hypothetical protein